MHVDERKVAGNAFRKEDGEETFSFYLKKCRISSLTDNFLNHGPPFKPPNSAIVDTYDRAVRFALLLKANPSANLFFEWVGVIRFKIIILIFCSIHERKHHSSHLNLGVGQLTIFQGVIMWESLIGLILKDFAPAAAVNDNKIEINSHMSLLQKVNLLKMYSFFFLRDSNGSAVFFKLLSSFEPNVTHVCL